MAGEESKARRTGYESGQIDIIRSWHKGSSGKSVLLLVETPKIREGLEFAFQENLFDMHPVDMHDIAAVRAVNAELETKYDAIICEASSETGSRRILETLEAITKKNNKPLCNVIFLHEPNRLSFQYTNKNGDLPEINEVHDQARQIVCSVLYQDGDIHIEKPANLILTYAELTSRLKEDPGNPRLHLQAGLFYLKSNQSAMAARHFGKAIDCDPDNKILTSPEEDPRAELADLIQTHPGEMPQEYIAKIEQLTKDIEETIISRRVSGEKEIRVLGTAALSAGRLDKALALLKSHRRSIDNILLSVEAYAKKGDLESKREAFDLIEKAEQTKTFYAEGRTYQVGLRLPRITGFNTLYIGQPIKHTRGRIVIKRYEHKYLARAHNETDNVNVLTRQRITLLNGQQLHLADYAVLLEAEDKQMAYIIMPLIKDATGIPAKGIDNYINTKHLTDRDRIALSEWLTDAQTALQNAAIVHRNPASTHNATYKIELQDGESMQVGYYTKLLVEQIFPFVETSARPIRAEDKKRIIDLWQSKIDAPLRNVPEAFFRPFFDNRIENTLITFPKNARTTNKVEGLLTEGILHRVDLEKGERRNFLTDELMAWGHEWMRTLGYPALEYLTIRKIAEILIDELPKIGENPEELVSSLWMPGEFLHTSAPEINRARAELEKITAAYMDDYFSYDLKKMLALLPIASAERHMVVASYQIKRVMEHAAQITNERYGIARRTEKNLLSDFPKLRVSEKEIFEEYCILSHFIKTQQGYIKYHKTAAKRALQRCNERGNFTELTRRLEKIGVICGK